MNHRILYAAVAGVAIGIVIAIILALTASSPACAGPVKPSPTSKKTIKPGSKPAKADVDIDCD